MFTPYRVNILTLFCLVQYIEVISKKQTIIIGCVYHHTSGVELRIANDFQGDFADDKRKAVLIRGLETPFFCFTRFDSGY